MLRRLLASAACAALLTGTAMIATAWAQMSPPPAADQDTSGAVAAPERLNSTPLPPTANPTPSPPMAAPEQVDHGSTPSASPGTRHTTSRSIKHIPQTAQGHSLDNISDKLNTCESQSLPAAERQACIDSATRM